ncbi:hypothetical protein H0H92_014459 [Tricholoma furcatifolium]|nr:hypothetical protein H0H92_014459 [Tricholoma furcatifolium]
MSPAVILAPRDCDPNYRSFEQCSGGLSLSTYAPIVAAAFVVILVLSCMVHRRRRQILAQVEYHPRNRPVIIISPRPAAAAPAPPVVFEPAPPYEPKRDDQPIQYPPPSYSPG